MKKIITILIITIFLFLDSTAQSINYSYDSLNRITEVFYPDSSIIIYTYDASGNRMHKTDIKSNIIKTCPQESVTFYAGTSNPENEYQWQVDTLTGFFNIVDGTIYSGTASPSLVLTSPPTDWYNNKYRCIITDSNGPSYSTVFTLKFELSWNGSIDTAWENAGNWNCDHIPDEFTDVYIPATALNFPQVNSEAVCRSISLQVKTNLKINSMDKLRVTGFEY